MAGAGLLAHEHDQLRDHDVSRGQKPSHPSERIHVREVFVHGHESFTLPTIQICRLWHALGHFLAGDAADSSRGSSSPDNPGHTHHSLAQLLASGLIEHTIDLPQLDCIFVSFTFLCLPASDLLLEAGWDALTASRGPPSARS